MRDKELLRRLRSLEDYLGLKYCPRDFDDVDGYDEHLTEAYGPAKWTEEARRKEREEREKEEKSK